MARVDILNEAKNILQGAGLGEKPSIRMGSGSVSGPTNRVYTFALATGEGAKVKPGDTLSSLGSATAAACLHVRVVAVTGDTVSVVTLNGVAPTDTLVGAPLEHNSEVPESFIHTSIDQIIESWLWPAVYEINTGSVSPNLSTGQVEVPATVESIFQAFQVVSNEVFSIPSGLVTNLPTITGHTSTGRIATFGAIDGSNVYYSYLSRVTDATSNVGLQHLIGLGAAALASGKVAFPAITERSKRDNQGKNQQAVGSVSGTLWRDFLNTKAAYGEATSEDVVRWEIHRG